MICIYNEHLKWTRDVDLKQQMSDIFYHETGSTIDDFCDAWKDCIEYFKKALERITELVKDVAHLLSNFLNEWSHDDENKSQLRKTWNVPKNISMTNLVDVNKPMFARARSNLRG